MRGQCSRDTHDNPEGKLDEDADIAYPAELESVLYVEHGVDAVRHLFRLGVGYIPPA